jgi:hypothetical protein
MPIEKPTQKNDLAELERKLSAVADEYCGVAASYIVTLYGGNVPEKFGGRGAVTICRLGGGRDEMLSVLQSCAREIIESISNDERRHGWDRV